MKLVKENINEAVKHLSAMPEEEIFQNFFSDGELLFDEFVPFVQKIEQMLKEAGYPIYAEDEEGNISYNEEKLEKFKKQFLNSINEAIEYCY